MENNNYFTKLNELNVNSMVEKKNGLSYLSWASAWAGLKKSHPNATSKNYENESGMPYFKSEEGYIVKVGVTVDGLEHISYLPVMDLRNQALKVADMMQINKALQRALVKAIALHGYGLYIYAGEDMPENSETVIAKEISQTVVPEQKLNAQTSYVSDKLHCGKNMLVSKFNKNEVYCTVCKHKEAR